MKLSELTTAENPISGKKFNLLDIGQLWHLALGAGAVLLAVNIGQKVFGAIGARVPYVSTRIQDPIAPTAPAPQQMNII